MADLMIEAFFDHVQEAVSPLLTSSRSDLRAGSSVRIAIAEMLTALRLSVDNVLSELCECEARAATPSVEAAANPHRPSHSQIRRLEAIGSDGSTLAGAGQGM
jgi:hypothetical protein